MGRSSVSMRSNGFTHTVMVIVLLTLLSIVSIMACLNPSLQDLHRVKFSKAVTGASYQSGEGVTLNANDFTLKPPLGSQTYINYGNKVNIKSGFSISFQYAYSGTSTTTNNGFAFVIQSNSAESREGSNQWLGYRTQKTLALEIDYFDNYPGLSGNAKKDISSPHMALMDSGVSGVASAESLPGNTCTSATKCALITGTGATTGGGTVELTIIQTTNAGQITVTAKHTVTGGGTVTFSTTYNSASAISAIDSSGLAYIGFSSSATDTKESFTYTISNVVVKTAGIGNLSLSPTPSSPSVVADVITDSQAYDYDAIVRDACSNAYTQISEEVLALTNPRFTGFDNNQCVNGPLSPAVSSRAGNAVVYRLRQACKLVTSGNTAIGKFIVNYGTAEKQLDAQARFIARPAVARTSNVIGIQSGSTTLCNSAATCAATFTNNPITAGAAVTIRILTKDEFGNDAVNTDATVRLAPTETAWRATATGSTVSVQIVPEKVVVDSPLEVSVNGQLLASLTKLSVVAGVPSSTYSSVISGAGLSQYIAGNPSTFVLQLQDRFNNAAKGNNYLNSIQFYLRDSNGNSCKTAHSSYENTCATTITPSSNNEQVQFTVSPKVVGQYYLICTIDGETCNGIPTTGFSITVVAAAEDVTKSTFERLNLPFWPVPTNTNNAAYQSATGLTAPTTSDYAVVDSTAVIHITVKDRFGNTRTAQNLGNPFSVVIGWGSSSDTLPCTGTAPPTTTLITAASRCQYSTQNGYVLSIVPKKTSYFTTMTSTTVYNLHLTTSNNSAQSTAKVFFLALSPAADPTKTVITRSTSGTPVAGNVVTWSTVLKDSYENEILPLHAGASDPIKDFLLFSADIASTNSIFKPDQGTAWAYSAGAWKTSYRIRGAHEHKIKISFRGTLVGNPDLTPVNSALVFTPTANIPYFAAPRVELKTVASDAKKVGATLTWTLYDEYQNPTTVRSTSTPTLDAVDGPNKALCNAGVDTTTAVCVLNSATCTAEVELTRTQASFACDYQLQSNPLLKHYPPPLTGLPRDIAPVSVPVAADNSIKVRFDWAKGNVQPTGTFNNANLVLTAGEEITLRFTSDASGQITFEIDQLVVSFIRNEELTIPGTIVSGPTPHPTDPKIAFIRYQITQSGPFVVKAQYSVSTVSFSSTFDTGANGSLRVNPAAFSLQQSFASAPSSFTACQNPTATGGPTNHVTIRPYDQYGNQLNDIESTAQTDATQSWTSTTLTWFDLSQEPTRVVIPIATTGQFAVSPITRNFAQNVWTFNFCKTKSDYWKFGYSAQSSPTAADSLYASSFTYVQAAQPTKTTFTAEQFVCVVGDACSLTFEVRDSFDNPVTKDVLDSQWGVAATSNVIIPTASAQSSGYNTYLGNAQELPSNLKTVNSSSVTWNDATGTIVIQPDVLRTLPTGDNLQEVELTLQFSQSGVATMNKVGSVKLNPQNDPSFYRLAILSNTAQRFVLSHTESRTGDVSTFTSSCTPADGCPMIPDQTSVDDSHTMILTLYDAYFNPWSPSSSTTYSGVLSLSQQTSVALFVDSTLSGNTITVRPTILTSGEYSVDQITIGRVNLPGFKYKTVPGAINRWSFAHPDFGQTRVAGASFTIRATPYDKSSNIVTNAAQVRPRATSLKLVVLEGSYDCKIIDGNYNPSIYTVNSKSSSTIDKDVTTLVNFNLLRAEEYIPSGGSATTSNGEWVLTYTTNRAGTLAASGAYLPYSYFINDQSLVPNTLPTSFNPVLGCAQGTITFVPHSINQSGRTNDQSDVAMTPDLKDKTLQAGDDLSFGFILVDNKQWTDPTSQTERVNPIAYYEIEDDSTGPIIELLKCVNNATTTDVLCATGAPSADEDCKIEPTTNKVQALITFNSELALHDNEDNTGKVAHFAIRYTPATRYNAAFTQAGVAIDTTFTTNCKSVPVHHGRPASIYFEDENPSTSPQPPLFADDNGIFAGTPTVVKLFSLDALGTRVDYSSSAFNAGGVKNNTVNKFLYNVTLTLTQSDNTFYHHSRLSNIPLPYGLFQEVTIAPIWPGNYTVTAQILTVDWNTYQTSPFLNPLTNAEVKTTRNLIVKSPICEPGFVYKPTGPYASNDPSTWGECIAQAENSEATFTCYVDEQGTIGTVKYSEVSDCVCYDANLPQGIIWTKAKMNNGLDIIQRCTTTSDNLILSEKPAPRVCPAGHHLCGDLLTCVTDEELCPSFFNTEARCGNDEFRCFDGSCVQNLESCGSEIVCPSNGVLCPNNKCVPTGANSFCQQVRPCLIDNGNSFAPQIKSLTCPSSGAQCVEKLSECSTQLKCPEGFVKCDNNACVENIDLCPTLTPAPVPIIQPTGCPTTRPFLCPDQTCAVDHTFCSTLPSCNEKGDKPILCPDGLRCVGDIDECSVIQPIEICDPNSPTKSFRCPTTNTCVARAVECPPATTCPFDLPIKCAMDGRCVETKAECDNMNNDDGCPESSPFKCPSSGKCVTSKTLCETPVVCPYYRPIKCSTGQCVNAIEECNSKVASTNSTCAVGYQPCPGLGLCVETLAFCPTIRQCPPDQVRCDNGVCYEHADKTLTAQDICPKTNTLSCSSLDYLDTTNNRIVNFMSCPIANSGFICRPTLMGCPTDVVCPSNAPLRCGDARCVANLNDCNYHTLPEFDDGAWNVPSTSLACGESTFVTSNRCATPASCPAHSPIKCLDGSCVRYLTDCEKDARPSTLQCSMSRPFKCPDGSCQINAHTCSMAACDPSTPIRCPTTGQIPQFIRDGNNNIDENSIITSFMPSQRCVAKIEDCNNVYDLNTSVNSPCVFGQRCSDGTCVAEGRLCPQRVCPLDAPYLCPTGVCAQNQFMCQTLEGCPFDLPFYCPLSATCVSNEKACNSLKAQHKSKTSPKIIECNENEVLCGDGSCRTSQDECITTGPFGCPSERPIRCGNGECVARPDDNSSTNSEYRCRTNTADYNACPASLPVRCPGGMCAMSLSRCPIYSQLDVPKPVCRKSKIATQVDYLRNKVKKWENRDMTVTCDDGSCAFSLSECPIITPCAKNQIRCPNGACMTLPFSDLSSAATREQHALRSFFGATCPRLPTPTGNRCPEHLPYMCQSGECALDRTQCLSNYPYDLRASTSKNTACCGPKHSFDHLKADIVNADGEPVYGCTALPTGVTCNIEDNTTQRSLELQSGCPHGMLRCPTSGFCVDPSKQAELCTVYDDLFTNFTKTMEIDESLTNNNALNITAKGCPINTPVKCANGQCKIGIATQKGVTISTSSNGPSRGISDDVCPPSIACTNPFFPYLCGDGQCVTDSKYCRPIVVRCKETIPEQTKPTKQNPYPVPIEPTGENKCRAACPFTLQCVGVPYKKIQITDEVDGEIVIIEERETTDCDWSKLSTVCNNLQVDKNALIQCPTTRPYLCQDGLCVNDASQCVSPFFDVRYTTPCNPNDPEQAYQCYDGTCRRDPFSCIHATAVANGFPAPIREEGILGTNICSSPLASYVCPNGLCVSDASQCGVYPACPAGAMRCRTGICALPSAKMVTHQLDPNNATLTVDVMTNIAPVCQDDPDTPGEAYNTSCDIGFIRCSDGTCRQSGTCPISAGCPIDKPFHCTWRANTQCVALQPGDDINKVCLGFESNGDKKLREDKDKTSFKLLDNNNNKNIQSSTSSLVQYLRSNPDSIEFIKQRFPQLNMKQFNNEDDNDDNVSSFKLLQDTTTTNDDDNVVPPEPLFKPDPDFVEACYENCERDISASTTTVLLTSTQGVKDLIVSSDKRGIAHTTITVPPNAIPTSRQQLELSIYPTALTLFNGKPTTSQTMYTPYNWKSPKKPPTETSALKEFSTTVISTPFTCEVKYNQTTYTNAHKNNKNQYHLSQPIIVSSYVDKSYYLARDNTNDNSNDFLTEPICPQTTTFDSALLGQGCGGILTITSSTLSVDYNNTICNWPMNKTIPRYNMTTFSFVAESTREHPIYDDPYTGEKRYLYCWKITQSERLFADNTPIKGSKFCTAVSDTRDLVLISFPENFIVTPSTTNNLLTQQDFIASLDYRTVPPPDLKINPMVTLNVRLPSVPEPVCKGDDNDIGSSGSGFNIASQDICLGAYTNEMKWKCMKQSYEDRTIVPAQRDGSDGRLAHGKIEDNCSSNAYAFLYVQLPPPSQLKESFCWFCKYGWIILVVGIIFVVVLLIVILLALKFMADRVKYKEQQAKLKELQETAQDLQENQGGLGVADADQEIIMSLNPLVLQLQDLNKQLEDTNQQLGSQAKEEEYHITRLQQQRQRIKAEIQRLEEEMQKTDAQSNKAKRVDDKPMGGNMMPAQGAQLQLAGPVRAGGNNNGPSGPTPAGGNLTGPMRANNNR